MRAKYGYIDGYGLGARIIYERIKAGHDFMSYYPLREMMGAITGWEATVEELVMIGKRTSALLHTFNLREVFKPNDFTMPPRAAGDPQFKVWPF